MGQGADSTHILLFLVAWLGKQEFLACLPPISSMLSSLLGEGSEVRKQSPREGGSDMPGNLPEGLVPAFSEQGLQRTLALAMAACRVSDKALTNPTRATGDNGPLWILPWNSETVENRCDHGEEMMKRMLLTQGSSEASSSSESKTQCRV